MFSAGNEIFLKKENKNKNFGFLFIFEECFVTL